MAIITGYTLQLRLIYISPGICMSFFFLSVTLRHAIIEIVSLLNYVFYSYDAITLRLLNCNCFHDFF